MLESVEAEVWACYMGYEGFCATSGRRSYSWSRSTQLLRIDRTGFIYKRGDGFRCPRKGSQACNGKLFPRLVVATKVVVVWHHQLLLWRICWCHAK
jgi:hypothetical protein